MTELPEIERYAKEILAKGAQNVIISMAGDGALLVSPNGTYFAKPIKGEVKNSVGAGDSMVAGFTGKLATTGDVIEAFNGEWLVEQRPLSQMIWQQLII